MQLLLSGEKDHNQSASERRDMLLLPGQLGPQNVEELFGRKVSTLFRLMMDSRTRHFWRNDP